MDNTEKDKSLVDRAGDNLFNFAVDRKDIKTFIAHLPHEVQCKPATVEYELQILKIISVGWSISFYLENHPHKSELAELFWKAVLENSESLSETTGLMTGHDIDYFQILKDRLDMYVAALTEKPDATEPAAVIGPEFARACGNIDDVYTVMTGSRMFIAIVGSVKEYLETIKLL
jgi:hypothetical protein